MKPAKKVSEKTVYVMHERYWPHASTFWRLEAEGCHGSIARELLVPNVPLEMLPIPNCNANCQNVKKRSRKVSQKFLTCYLATYKAMFRSTLNSRRRCLHPHLFALHQVLVHKYHLVTYIKHQNSQPKTIGVRYNFFVSETYTTGNNAPWHGCPAYKSIEVTRIKLRYQTAKNHEMKTPPS